MYLFYKAIRHISSEILLFGCISDTLRTVRKAEVKRIAGFNLKGTDYEENSRY